MAKGDQVEVVVDMGGGMSRSFVIKATRDGRKVQVDRGPRDTVVKEVTRGGRDVVRTASFLTQKCLAVVESPAGEVGREPAVRKRRAVPGQLDLTHQEESPQPAGG